MGLAMPVQCQAAAMEHQAGGCRLQAAACTRRRCCTLQRHRHGCDLQHRLKRGRAVVRCDSTDTAAAVASEVDAHSAEEENLLRFSGPTDGDSAGFSGFWELEEEQRLEDRPKNVSARLSAKDPSLNQTLLSSGTSVAQLFNQNTWEMHRSRRRYFSHLLNIHRSTVFKRILGPVLSVTLVAAAVCSFNTWSPRHWPRLCLAGTPHSLLGAALSLLLVFRTNNSSARFAEGRVQWGAVVKHSRNWMRLAAVYFPRPLLLKAAGYITAYCYCLKAHLRQGRSRKDLSDPTAYRDDPTQILHELLPDAEAAELLRERNRPWAVVRKMTWLAQESAAVVPAHVRRQLELYISELIGTMGACERLLSTPIPLSYTRHTLRCLVIWLLTLPLTLWPSLGWVAVPTSFVAAFMLLGIEEIGVQIEEPFAILPLQPLCEVIKLDTSDAIRHSFQNPAPACSNVD